MNRYVSAVIMTLLIAALLLAPSAQAVLCDGGGSGKTADWAYWDYPSVGFIDLNAAYYYYLFNAAENDTLRFEFSGDFPHSRYMSFTLYNVNNQLPVGVLNDYEIEPDAGNQNPFVPGTDRATADRSYTVRMVPAGSDQAGLPNTLVIPADVEIACLLLRVYLPDDGQPLDGGVGMPDTSVFDDATGEPADGPAKLRVEDYLSGNLGDTLGLMTKTQEYYAALSTQVESWRLEIPNAFPQYENPYIWMPLAHPGPGRVALVRFRAPSFTDTGGGEGAFSGEEDVRYFSVSVGGLLTTMTSRTINDSELAIDDEGYVNLVIGAPWLLAPFARLRGWNFVPTRQHAQPILVFRQMLPQADFEGSFLRIFKLDLYEPPGTQVEELKASNFVGDWAPQGEYCTTWEFIKMLCGAR